MTIHRYTTKIQWQGDTGEGYEHYGRGHDALAPPAEAALRLSADPAFRGDPSLLNPEQLVVLAASSCQLLSFLAVAARGRLEILAYHDEAEAEMVHRQRSEAHSSHADGSPPGPARMAIDRIRLHPVITVRGGPTLERVQRLVALAHEECFIANSLRTEITVDPRIVFAPGDVQG